LQAVISLTGIIALRCIALHGKHGYIYQPNAIIHYLRIIIVKNRERHEEEEEKSSSQATNA